MKSDLSAEVANRSDIEEKFTSLYDALYESDHAELTRTEIAESVEKSLVDEIPDFAIYMLSPEGTILSWNKGAMLATGYSAKEIIGMNFSVMGTIEDTAQKKYDFLLSDCSTRGKIEHKYWKLKKDGNTYWSSETITAIRGKKNELIGFSVISRDLTAQHQIELEISNNQAQLKILAAKQEQIREEERTRIARELHDVLGQALTGFKLGLNSTASSLAVNSEDSSLFSISLQLRQMSSNVDYMIKCVRKIASELRPPILDSLGLVAALEWQIGEFSKTTAVQCEFICNTPQIAADKNQTTALFRCTQELLTNIARHAEASKVVVSLDRQDDRMLLEVVDDGRGISEKAVYEKKTLGLMGIQERMDLVGGSFSICANGDVGTKAILQIPIKAKAITAGSI